MDAQTTRRLAAILSADAAGFSRLMGADEARTHRVLSERRALIDAAIAAHAGRIVGTAGDSVLAEFPSVVAAVAGAIEMQRGIAAANASLATEERMLFRIGVNLGDVIVAGDDIFGDGVNMAARLQAAAEPGGILVSQAVVEQVRGKLPCAFRDLGSRRLKNIRDPVRLYAVVPGATAAAGRRTPTAWIAAAIAGVIVLAGAGIAVWQRDRGAPESPAATATAPDAPAEAAGPPLVAVLPLSNLSGGPTHDYFSDGMTQDITTALGRWSGLSVLAPAAVAQLKLRNATVQEVGERVNAQYVVDGTIRRAGDRLRVTASLADARTGVQLWSESFDGETGDLFAVQDAISRRIAAALGQNVARVEQMRALAKPTENLAAYDLVLRGRELVARSTRADNREARRLFERSVALDPRYAEAHAALGFTYYDEVRSGWTEFVGEALDQAEVHARDALAIDERTASAHRLLGVIHLFRQRYDLATGALDRALELNPSDAVSHAYDGAIRTWAGDPEEAVRAIETAFRLDPGISQLAAFNLGMAYYQLGRHENAVRALEEGLPREPNATVRAFMHAVLAASYARLGRRPEAEREAAAVRRSAPFFTVAAFVAQFREPADRERFATGLRKAGLE